RLLEASTMKSRRGFAIQRLMNAMRQAHADGWFIVFDTLTLADDRLEAFYDNPNALSLILHLGNLFLIVQLHFSKLFLILKSGVNHTSRGSISTSTLPSIKLRKCSSKIITSILSFISGRLATKSNQIKQLIRN